MKTGNLRRKVAGLLERAAGDEFGDPSDPKFPRLEALYALGHVKGQVPNVESLVKNATREQLDAALRILEYAAGPSTQISQRELAFRERCREQRARFERRMRDLDQHPDRVALEQRILAAVQKVGRRGITTVLLELPKDPSPVVLETLATWSYLNIPDLLGVDPLALVKEHQALVSAGINNRRQRQREQELTQQAAAMLLWLRIMHRGAFWQARNTC